MIHFENHQEIFDRVAEHLLTQNQRSSVQTISSPNSCRYRLGELKCAIGCLIPDELYDPEMESHTVVGDSVRYLFDEKFLPFLHNLQRIHDVDPVDQWQESLDELCKVENLLEYPRFKDRVSK
jgi:hypothetical protein